MVHGMIVIWSGSIVSIPNGWQLCDGNNGSPDLRNKFVVGAGDTYAVNDTGGATTHTHTFTGDGHSHTIATAGDVGLAASNYRLTAQNSGESNANGTTNAGSSLPPYYALAYIMKL